MKKILFAIGLLLLLNACTKEFLDKKPSKSLLVPTTLPDFQALLDFVEDMNVAPGLNVIASDDFYRDDDSYGSLAPIAQGTYSWARNMYDGSTVNDWNKSYNEIFVANIVLDGLKALPDQAGTADYKAIRGGALFRRALANYGLVQEFAQDASQRAAPGIPVRLSPDVNLIAGRGTVAQTYAQVIADLEEAVPLLPVTAAYKSRPSRPAALALLARVALVTGDNDNAIRSAGACLALKHTLLDYNTLPADAPRPFASPLPNAADEVLYYATLISTSAYNSSSSTLVDSGLYRSYNDQDLRKALFFRDRGDGSMVFKGNYTGASTMFGGLAVDEVYLVRAEAYARKGQTALAMQDLNALMATRWETGTFVPFSAQSSENALRLVLQERRKELVGRGLRWGDLKRLNRDSRFATALHRQLNGQLLTLAPNGLNYVFPIPDNEVHSSGIAQNPRN